MKRSVQVFSLGLPFTFGRNHFLSIGNCLTRTLVNSLRMRTMSGYPGDTSSSRRRSAFVDGVWVGKDRQFILRHCSVISILSSDGSFFRYLDRDTMEDLFPLRQTWSGCFWKVSTSKLEISTSELSTMSTRLLMPPLADVKSAWLNFSWRSSWLSDVCLAW